MTISELHILNHADYDGEFREDEKTPGLSRFYCAVEQVRSRDPEHCLLLDAGDNINRILWHGREVFDGLALIGTDAMTLETMSLTGAENSWKKTSLISMRPFPSSAATSSTRTPVNSSEEQNPM